MKYTISNIIHFFRKDKPVFLVVILCILVSSILLNFSYGLYYHFQMENMELTGNMNRVGSEINQDAAPTRIQIQRFIEALPEEITGNIYFYFSAILPSYTESGLFNELESRIVYRDGTFQIPSFFRENTENRINHGRMISDNEESNGTCVAVVYSENGEWDAISQASGDGQTYITLFGKHYTVIGEQSVLPQPPIIPFLSVPEDFRYDRIVILDFDSLMTRRQYQMLMDTAQEYIPNAISFPDLPLPDADSIMINNNMIFTAVLIALLSVMNFAMLYRYIMEKRSRTLAVFRLVGCTKRKALLMYLNECIFLSVPVYCLGTGIFQLLLRFVLSGIFPYMSSAYRPVVYLMIFVFFLTVMLSVMLITISMHLRKNVIQEWKENAA